MTTPRIWTESPATLRTGLVLGVTAAALLGGCSKPPPEPPPPPPPVRQPPPPEPIEVAGLLQSMSVDERVEFANSQAPVSRDLAEAAIHLADAFARGDDRALSGMLDQGDKRILERLKSSEQWYDATERIEAVRVVSLDSVSRSSESPERADIALAVQDRDGAYVLAWSGRKVFDDWVFSASPSTDEVRPRASAWDGMAPSGVGGLGAMGGVDPELQQLLTKAMTAPDSLSAEELQQLLEMAKEAGVPDAVIQQIEQEIAKRQDRESGAGSGGGRSGGGGGSEGPRERRDPGPGPGGPG